MKKKGKKKITAKPCHRVGFGFDSHQFSNTGTLVFGGVEFKQLPALKGHSDGDAILHAIIDALLGAAGLGDIGDFYPDSSKKYKDISSLVLLNDVVKKLKRNRFVPIHVDVTVVAESPRLSRAKIDMKKKISYALSLPISAVNIKAKTPEGLDSLRVAKGIAVWAVATIHHVS